MKHIQLVDLFAGAGGTSSGALEACTELGFSADLLAINHWDIAIATHQKNHPKASHKCANVDSLNPRELFKEGAVSLLWASPEYPSLGCPWRQTDQRSEQGNSLVRLPLGRGGHQAEALSGQLHRQAQRPEHG